MLDNPTFKKVESLLNECSSLCTKEGWDFYGALFSGPYERFDILGEGGNDFIRRQPTIPPYNSRGLRMIRGLPVPENESIDGHAICQEGKPE